MLEQINCFQIFNLKPVFDINLRSLKEKYYELSKKHHPDIVKSNGNFQSITRAYNTLKDDYARAIYMRNKPLQRQPPASFLMDVLELEERVSTGRVNELMQIKGDMERRINECRSNYSDEDYLVKWRYYNRILKSIENRMDKILSD